MVGVVYMKVCVSRYLIEELAQTTDKQLRVISNIALFKADIATTKEIVISLRNKTILSLNNIVYISMHSLVMCKTLIIPRILWNCIATFLLWYVCV